MRTEKLLLTLLLSLLVTACTKKAPPPPPQTFHEHTIAMQGETLAVIASWYTGDSQNWKAIAEANPELKPNKLRLGDVVRIPDFLVKKTDPLTKKAFQNLVKKTVKVEPKKEDVAPQSTPAPVEVAPTSNPTPQPEPLSVEPTPEAAAPAATPETQSVPIETPIPPAVAVQPTEATAPISTPSSAEKTRDDLIDEILSK